MSEAAFEPLVGEWLMTSSFSPDPATARKSRMIFEWLPGRRFLTRREEVNQLLA